MDSTSSNIPQALLELLRLQKESDYQEGSKHYCLGLSKHPCSLPTSRLNGIFPRTHACLLLGLALLDLTAQVFISKIKMSKTRMYSSKHLGNSLAFLYFLDDLLKILYRWRASAMPNSGKRREGVMSLINRCNILHLCDLSPKDMKG